LPVVPDVYISIAGSLAASERPDASVAPAFGSSPRSSGDARRTLAPLSIRLTMDSRRSTNSGAANTMRVSE
jgi:hypothetical protein